MTESIGINGWELILMEHDKRWRRIRNKSPVPIGIACPNRRLSGWEQTPKGKYFVLRNVDGFLMKFSEAQIKKILEP
jgi:hypothetical protein